MKPGDKIEFDMQVTAVKCRVRKGYAEFGKVGVYLGYFHDGNREWAIIKWDDADDPDLFKLDAIEVVQEVWNRMIV